MKKIIIYFVVVTIFSSCVDGISEVDVNLTNSTNHKIEIIAFKNGKIDSLNSIKINSNESEVLSRVTGKGKLNLQPITLASEDSVFVIFDDSIKIRHNTITDTNSISKFYSYTNSKNINNIANYTKEVVDESKYSIYTKYTYTFTEQDYLEAQ